MQEANNLGIKVIQQIPKDKDAEILDKEGIELLFKKLKLKDWFLKMKDGIITLME